MQTVGMIGLGALGVLFGQRLMANGADVRILADKTRAEKYQKQGVTCNGAPVAFRYVTPEEAEPVDLMIFATKEGGLRGALWAGCARQPLALRYREENGSGILKKKNGGKSVVFLKSGRNCQFDSSVC